jgi:tRNA(Ile)-lysidine synthase
MMKRLEQKILNLISRENLISRGDRILVALSGGPDSVFALHFLLKYQKKFGIDIAAFHLNHLLRGKESDGDEKFCRVLCKKNNVDFFSAKVDVKNSAKLAKRSIEETARHIRYEKLAAISEKKKFNKIVTAHNSSDNSETVLMNLFTGCGLHGISGIPVKRGNIIRPLLSVTKKEILDYLEFNKIGYRVDSTNLSDDYKRNYLRNQIIPRLKEEFNPRLEDALFRSSRIFEQSKKAVEKLSDNLIDKGVEFSGNKITVSLDAVSQSDDLLGPLLRSAILKQFSLELTYDDYLMIKGLFGKQVGKKVSLSSNLTVRKERGKIEIFPPGETKNEIYLLKIGDQIRVGEEIIGLDETKPGLKTSKNLKKSEIIEADNIDDIFILRKWKSGDKFIPLGMRGFKKVSDFLTDQKVSSSEKNNQLLLTNRNNIVWICGLRIDDRYKITENTKRVIQLWIKQEKKIKSK